MNSSFARFWSAMDSNHAPSPQVVAQVCRDLNRPCQVHQNPHYAQSDLVTTSLGTLLGKYTVYHVVFLGGADH